MSERYRRLLQELSVPRLVGSAAHARVRERLKQELSARGYVVLEHAFPVRPPGRLRGPLYGGALLAWLSFATLVPSLAVRVAGGVVLLLAVLFPLRSTATNGVNLIGVRPRTRVAVWLAAHYDSKGQPISMALRLTAVALAVVGVVGLGGVWAGRMSPTFVIPGLLGGLLLLFNRATNGSPGALDNASALVTVLAVVDQLPAEAAVGVLFPDAEEYGLIGSRALVRERANLLADTAVLNLDGIDDRETTRCVMHRSGPTVDAVAAALGAKTRRFLPIVVDGWEFARVARECLTVMRGDWQTARVVHTPRDTADRLTFAGGEQVAGRIAAALRGLSAASNFVGG